MRNQDLYQLFIDQLHDIYSAEELIVESLPFLIKSSFHKELQETFIHHLKETSNQVRRLEKIFALLDLSRDKRVCKGMEGILKEGKEQMVRKTPSPVLDAVIIGGARKVEHYEIASYSSLLCTGQKIS